jgi:PKHD-type hydroxylase
MPWKFNNLLPNEPFVVGPNVFSDDEISSIIHYGKTIGLSPAKVNHGRTDDDVRRTNISWITPNLMTEFIFKKISKSVIDLNNQFYRYDIDELEDLQFSEYTAEDQGMYGAHSDTGYDILTRKLSVSIQLSDPEDYDGGDLNFYRFHFRAPATAPKQKGSVIVFPSFVIHEVTPVTRGTRYSLVTWVAGPQLR